MPWRRNGAEVACYLPNIRFRTRHWGCDEPTEITYVTICKSALKQADRIFDLNLRRAIKQERKPSHPCTELNMAYSSDLPWHGSISVQQLAQI